jgi:hypothetical protein
VSEKGRSGAGPHERPIRLKDGSNDQSQA